MNRVAIPKQSHPPGGLFVEAETENITKVALRSFDVRAWDVQIALKRVTHGEEHSRKKPER
jgi:hypothetical protein